MKNKVGRPTKYAPEWMLDKILELMSEGASKVEVATELGITTETLYQWVNDPEKKIFSDTIKIGEELCQAWWERNGRINLHSQTFNPTLWYMNMKNRFGWADKQEVKQETILRDISADPLTETEWEENYGDGN